VLGLIQRQISTKSPPQSVSYSHNAIAEVVSRMAGVLNRTGQAEFDLRIELGRAYMEPSEVPKLCPGSMVPLDKLTGEPVDVYVNNRLVARGQLLVLNDHFCVRITELAARELLSAAA
jgi:flagellar motor switch protein FliN